MKVLMAASLPGWIARVIGGIQIGTPSLFMRGLTMAEVVVLGMQVKG